MRFDEDDRAERRQPEFWFRAYADEYLSGDDERVEAREDFETMLAQLALKVKAEMLDGEGPWALSTGVQDSLLLYGDQVVGQIQAGEQERRLRWILNAGEKAAEAASQLKVPA